MSNTYDAKEMVKKFFEEGYANKNYDIIMEYVAENYIIIESWGYWPDKEIESKLNN